MAAGENDGQRIVRRDFVAQAAAAFGSVGLVATGWPLIAQMAPNSATPPPEVMDIDLNAIPPATTKLVQWRGLPVFVRHRTREEIEEARNTHLSSLPDPRARNALLPERAPAIDSNRTKTGHEEWLVAIGLCTHLGCMLQANPPEDAAHAWFCPCHAARFDVSGRVRAGPARTNLPIPPYEFVGRGTIRIG
jgi:ubiquinol-cytochrome c reductase iron-sulfur subunit